jgi:ABC-type branched-subunit amino acid transport system substrate-binding protein
MRDDISRTPPRIPVGQTPTEKVAGGDVGAPKRNYTRTTTVWSDPDSRNEYMRRYQAAWRARNPERYRAATKRWRYNAKLKECGL